LGKKGFSESYWNDEIIDDGMLIIDFLLSACEDENGDEKLLVVGTT